MPYIDTPTENIEVKKRPCKHGKLIFKSFGQFGSFYVCQYCYRVFNRAEKIKQ